MKTKNSFTLLELLIATILLSVITTSLYNFFFSGKQVYQRIHAHEKNQQPFLHLTALFQKDISSLVAWKTITLVGQQSSLYLNRESSYSPKKILHITYDLKERYQESTKVYDLQRHEMVVPLPEEKHRAPKETFTVLSDITSLQFEYLTRVSNPSDDDISPTEEDFDFDEDTPENPTPAIEKVTTQWIDTWKESYTPIAVRCSITLLNTQSNQFTQWIPRMQYSSFRNIPVLELDDASDNSYETENE